MEFIEIESNLNEGSIFSLIIFINIIVYLNSRGQFIFHYYQKKIIYIQLSYYFPFKIYNYAFQILYIKFFYF